MESNLKHPQTLRLADSPRFRFGSGGGEVPLAGVFVSGFGFVGFVGFCRGCKVCRTVKFYWVYRV